MKKEEIEKITRLEVIDKSGIRYVNWHIDDLDLSVQDDGKTLKIFVNCDFQEVTKND